MTRIAVVNDHKNIVPYSRAAHVTVFVNEDGELRVLSGNRTVEDIVRVQQMSFDIADPPDRGDIELMNKRTDVLICGEISKSAKLALGQMEISVYGGITGTVDDVIGAYLNGTLKTEENGADERPGARELLEYTRTVEADADTIREGYEKLAPELTDEDKLWLLDQWIRNVTEWQLFGIFIRLFDVKLGLERALGYAEEFMLKDKYDNGMREDEHYVIQSDRLFKFRLVFEHLEPECAKEFVDESMVIAVKAGLILFVEFLAEQGADIDHISAKYGSVARCEKRMVDLTLKSYLEEYRRTGRKPAVDAGDYFVFRSCFSVYEPMTGVPGVEDIKAVLNEKTRENSIPVCPEIPDEYGKLRPLNENTSASDMVRFIKGYDWSEGPYIPRLIAMNPNCPLELFRMMYVPAEECLYKTEDEEEILLWRCFLAELLLTEDDRFRK